MTTVLKLQVRHIPKNCMMCDFYVYGTMADIEIGSEWICVAGRIGRHGKETLTRNNVFVRRPDWCPLESEE